MSMIYSVIGKGNGHGGPTPSLKTLRTVSATLTAALAQFPPGADDIVPAQYAYNVDHLYALLQHLDRAVPRLGGVWLVGYWFFEDAWTTWSAHEDRKTAERWLPHWQKQFPGKDRWEVRLGDCPVGKFMPKGTRIDTVMAMV